MSERWNCFICSPQILEDLIEKNGWQGANKTSSKRKLPPHIVCSDISRGRERFEIPVFNNVDDAPAPLDFIYVTKHIGAEGVITSNNPSFLSCCSCTDNCKDPTKCECAILMGGDAYDRNGRLLYADRPAGN